MVTKRGREWYIRIRPFGGKEIGKKTSAASKTEARQIEVSIMTACRSGDYRALDPAAREVCVRMFRNQNWEVPLSLLLAESGHEELTLKRAVQIVLTDPEIRTSKNRQRLEECFFNIMTRWGTDLPVKSIKVPQIKLYRLDRLNEGAAPATVNKEKSALSRMFQILLEHELVDRNPARDVKNLSEKSGERQVYISHADFRKIMEGLPEWFQPVIETLYYTGMRYGELSKLTRSRLNLSRKMILIGPGDTKERDWKRVPIHRDLVPTLERVLKVRALGVDHVFIHNGEPLKKQSGRWDWQRAASFLNLEDPLHIHDLRHVWKANARRSRMDPEIREAILGHWFKEKSITERYGRVSDDELLWAIDSMTFDHGESELYVATQRR